MIVVNGARDHPSRVRSLERGDRSVQGDAETFNPGIPKDVRIDRAVRTNRREIFTARAKGAWQRPRTRGADTEAIGAFSIA